MAAAAQSFSHREHIAQKLACADCHGMPDLQPARENCVKCHQTPKIAALPPMHVRFDHQLHAKLGNIAALIAAAIDKGAYLAPPASNLRQVLNSAGACVACHRELASFVKPNRLRQMADCLLCHTQIDPPDSCAFCHAKHAQLRPANHLPDFLDTHTTGKLELDKTTCAVCHGRHFRCLGCH